MYACRTSVQTCVTDSRVTHEEDRYCGQQVTNDIEDVIGQAIVIRCQLESTETNSDQWPNRIVRNRPSHQSIRIEWPHVILSSQLERCSQRTMELPQEATEANPKVLMLQSGWFEVMGHDNLPIQRMQWTSISDIDTETNRRCFSFSFLLSCLPMAWRLDWQPQPFIFRGWSSEPLIFSVPTFLVEKFTKIAVCDKEFNL